MDSRNNKFLCITKAVHDLILNCHCDNYQLIGFQSKFCIVKLLSTSISGLRADSIISWTIQLLNMKQCTLYIPEKMYIPFHSEDATLNQISEFDAPNPKLPSDPAISILKNCLLSQLARKCLQCVNQPEQSHVYTVNSSTHDI